MREIVKSIYNNSVSLLPPHARLHVQFLRAHRCVGSLKAPRTFSEHIQHRKLFDHNPLFATYSDKIAVKPIVADLLGSEWITPTLWVGSDIPAKPDWPRPYVLKASHGSQMNYFVRTPADENIGLMRKLVKRWLNERWSPAQYEVHYNDIVPRLLVEPLIETGGADLRDYKIFVFGGVAQFIQVDTERFTAHRRTFFDRDWKRQAFELSYEAETHDIARPRYLAEMIAAAEKLAAPFAFARIDFYDLPDGPRFGEITFTPDSGFKRFRPTSTDRAFGDLWSKAEAGIAR